MSVLDEILARFQQICDDDKEQDGWDAFADVWEFVTEKAAQHPAPAHSSPATDCYDQNDAAIHQRSDD